jgi:uncharacterized repeat protein (TIGR01451 family)
MFTGEEYWVNIVGEPMRFYTDTNAPTLTIYDEWDSEGVCEGPECIGFDVCELETWTTNVFVQIYDQDLGLYWNGTAYVDDDTVWVSAELEGEDLFTGESFWLYCDTTGMYTNGHTYTISAYAVDASGCESETDEATLHIYNPSINVEKTVGDDLEQQSVPVDTNVTFAINMTNIGDVDFDYLNVFDFLPENLTYVPGSATYSYNGANPHFLMEPTDGGYDGDLRANILEWIGLNGIDVGEYLVITFNATVESCDVLEENLAHVYGYNQCDPAEDNDNATVMGMCGNPSLTFSKEVWNETLGDWDDETWAPVHTEDPPTSETTLFVISEMGQGTTGDTTLEAYAISGDGTGLSFVGDHDLPNAGWGAVGMALDDVNDKLFVTYEMYEYIIVFDGTTYTQIHEILTPGYDLAGIAVDTATDTIYVVDRGESTIYMYDTVTYALVSELGDLHLTVQTTTCM